MTTGAPAPTIAGEPQPTPRRRPPARTNKPRRRLAVVTTAYHYLSHAYHICGRFLHGYLRSGRYHFPDWGIAGMHVAQQNHKGDLSQELARTHKFPLFRTVGEALTLGGDKLAVDQLTFTVEPSGFFSSRSTPNRARKQPPPSIAARLVL